MYTFIFKSNITKNNTIFQVLYPYLYQNEKLILMNYTNNNLHHVEQLMDKYYFEKFY